METTKPDFDYSFRPEAYDAEAFALTRLINSIQGQARREIVEEMIAEGRIDELNEMMFDEQMPLEQRRVWGQIDPRFMGGEYLPVTEEGEIEIARIVLESVTQDVVSIRAKRCAEGWQYRVEDEYETKYPLAYKTSPAPLTLGQMIELIDGLDYVLTTLEYNFANPDCIWWDDSDEEEVEGLEEQAREFASVSSPFYPELEPYYIHIIETWIDTEWTAFMQTVSQHKAE